MSLLLYIQYLIVYSIAIIMNNYYISTLIIVSVYIIIVIDLTTSSNPISIVSKLEPNQIHLMLNLLQVYYYLYYYLMILINAVIKLSEN